MNQEDLHNSNECFFEKEKPIIQSSMNLFSKKLEECEKTLEIFNAAQVVLRDRISNINKEQDDKMIVIANDSLKRDSKMSNSIAELELKITSLREHLDNGWQDKLMSRIFQLVEKSHETDLKLREKESEINSKIKENNNKMSWKLVLILFGTGGIATFAVQKIFEILLK